MCGLLRINRSRNNRQPFSGALPSPGRPCSTGIIRCPHYHYSPPGGWWWHRKTVSRFFAASPFADFYRHPLFVVRELRQLISRIQRQPGVGINVLHQKTPHRFHRIGKTVLHILNTGDITTGGGISGFVSSGCGIAAASRRRVYPPALIFLPINRNLIHLHRLALFTGYKRKHLRIFCQLRAF